jgi:hypothetical protein
MSMLRRLAAVARALFAAAGPPPGPECWCRPSMLLALRYPAAARSCVEGWHAGR